MPPDELTPEMVHQILTDEENQPPQYHMEELLNQLAGAIDGMEERMNFKRILTDSESESDQSLANTSLRIRNNFDELGHISFNGTKLEIGLCDKTVGVLFFNDDDALQFEGDVDESARAFLEILKYLWRSIENYPGS